MTWEVSVHDQALQIDSKKGMLFDICLLSF